MIPGRLARDSLVGLLVAAAVAGCGGGGARRLQGKWHGQRSEGVATAAAAQANTFATAMQLEVKGDAITVTTSASSQSGHYKVVKEDKTTVVITTDKDGPSEPQTFTFVDDKTVKWAVLAGQSIVFAKE
jgi:hypothetical protein